MARFTVELELTQLFTRTAYGIISVEAPYKEAIGINLESMIEDIENKQAIGENPESMIEGIMIEGIKDINWEFVSDTVTSTDVDITRISLDEAPNHEPDIDLTPLPARFPMARYSKSLSERQNEGRMILPEAGIHTLPIDLDIKIHTLGTELGKPSDQGPAEVMLMADGLNGRISCRWDTRTDSVEITVCTTRAVEAYDLLTQDKYKGKAQKLEIDESKFTLYNLHITGLADPGILTLITDCIPLIR